VFVCEREREIVIVREKEKESDREIDDLKKRKS